jgi:hypothetical protein
MFSRSEIYAGLLGIAASLWCVQKDEQLVARRSGQEGNVFLGQAVAAHQRILRGKNTMTSKTPRYE